VIFNVIVDPRADTQLRQIEATTDLSVARGRYALDKLVEHLKLNPLQHEHARQRVSGKIYGAVKLRGVPLRVERSIDDDLDVTIDHIEHSNSNRPRLRRVNEICLSHLRARIHARSLSNDDLLDELAEAQGELASHLSSADATQLSQAIDVLKSERDNRAP